jgi:hypothetical protein
MHVCVDQVSTIMQLFMYSDLRYFYNIITDLINTLPGIRSVNTSQHETIEEAVFSVGPTDTPIGWLDSNHVICVYCRSMSVPWLYNESCVL